MPKPTDKKIPLKGIFVLLRQSWQLYRAAFGLLVGYAAWILLPYIGIVGLTALVPAGQLNTEFLPYYIVLVIIQAIITVWAGNAIVLSIDRLAENKKIDPTKINQTSWQLIVPLIMVAFLEVLVVLGGFLLLIIPGIIFTVWFTFAQIAVILDDKRGVEALGFSRSLVVGRWWQVFRTIILGPFVIFLGYVLVLFILVGLGLLISGEASAILKQNHIPLWPDIIENVVNVFIFPLFLVYWTLLYKNVKETVGVV